MDTMRSPTAPLFWRGILAVIVGVIAAGAVALIWPDITALALVLVIAAWAFVTGLWEVALAFKSGETAGQRALLGLTGLVTIALSVVFAIRPDLGAATIADVFGLSSITLGVAALVIAANLHRDTAVARRAVSAA
jgi:uncharacterized membrane protein HdeD (DUF308 family)